MYFNRRTVSGTSPNKSSNFRITVHHGYLTYLRTRNLTADTLSRIEAVTSSQYHNAGSSTEDWSGIERSHFKRYFLESSSFSECIAERLHRTLKAAIMSHNTFRWSDVLPNVLLGMRAAFYRWACVWWDLKDAWWVLLHQIWFSHIARWLHTWLRRYFSLVKPTKASRHGTKPTFV